MRDSEIPLWNKVHGNLLLRPRHTEAVAKSTKAYVTLYNTYLSTIRRTYELPYIWYYIVFQPMNIPYANNPDWFKAKGIDAIRKKFRLKTVTCILTRETLDCAKVHINMLICSSDKLLRFHNGKCFHKYTMNVQKLSSLSDRENVLSYMCKEELKRTFVKYIDYLITFPAC